MKRLIKKEDLQDFFKGDLIDEVILNEIVNKDTNELYQWEELRALSYDNLVDILVDSKKIHILEL